MWQKLFSFWLLFVLSAITLNGQSIQDSLTAKKQYNNTIRYNVSGPLLFGYNYIVLGYERLLNNRQSMSMNLGHAVLPKILSFSTDSFSLSRTRKNAGINFSLDYRFYLSKENKYGAPHGIYIGPYYSYNQFNRDTEWDYTNTSNNNSIGVDTKFNIHTFGAEMGYQFVLWKDRLALDFVLIGPGVSKYSIKSNIIGNLSPADRGELLEAIQQLISQKYPGMDYVIGDKQFDAQGNLSTWNTGFRYIIHIGFRF
jgi:Protein of unknown function (DUF3575)